MTNIVNMKQNLPASIGLSSLAADAMAGLTGSGGGGALFPHISIKQSRWRLIDTAGEENVLNTFDIHFALVAANPAKSKTFYFGKYDPAGEPKAPDCYSDDGARPAADSPSPQSQTCATCPHNVWGSDVNPVSGKKNKKCKDSKRIAVMLLGDPDQQIYMWRLSPMNMLAFIDAVKDIARQGIDLEKVAMKASFDVASDFPKVKFDVLRPMNNEELAIADGLRKSEGAKAAVGLGGIIVVEGPKPAVVVEEPKPEQITQEVAKPAPQKAKGKVNLDDLLDANF